MTGVNVGLPGPEREEETKPGEEENSAVLVDGVEEWY